MKKWKTLRDSFVRDFRLMKKTDTGVPASKKKKYVFYDQLSFLLPHVKGCENTASNIAPPEEQTAPLNEDDNGNVSEGNRDTVPPRSSNPGSSSSVKERLQRQERMKKRPAVGLALASASKNITNIMQESLQIQKASLETDKFGNKAFLLSFVPTMDNLPPHLAFDVRMQITEVFRNAVANASHTYIPCGTSGPTTGDSPSTSSNAHHSSDPGRVTPASVYNLDQSDVDNPDSPDFSDPNSQQFNISDFIKLK